MPRIRMTAKWVQSIKPKKGKQTDYYDDKTRMEGAYFGLRVSQAGAKQWFVMYRKNGALKRYKLGRYYEDERQQRERPDHLPLADARDKAAKKLAEIVDGDPAKEKAERKRAPTVDDLIKDYVNNLVYEDYQVAKKSELTLRAQPLKKTWKRDRQLLEKELSPDYGSLRVGELDRWAVKELLKDVAKDRPIWSNRFMEVGRRAYNWGMREKKYNRHIEYNPFANQDRQPEAKRDRWLHENELREVWRAYGALGGRVGAAFKLLLLTAQRRSEVLTMRWKDIDGDWWTIPAERTKSGRSHRVPLTETVTEILASLERVNQWVFSSPRYVDDQPMRHLDKAHERIRNDTGIDFRIHDLRRTATTYMAQLKVPRLHAAMVLNHVVKSVTGDHYDQHSYEGEKREALTQWDEHLRGIVS